MQLFCLGKARTRVRAVASAPVYSAGWKKLCSLLSCIPVSIPRAARSSPWAYFWLKLHATATVSVWHSLSPGITNRELHSSPNPRKCCTWERPAHTLCFYCSWKVAGTGEAEFWSPLIFHSRLFDDEQDQVSGVRHKSQLTKLMLLVWLLKF